MKQNKNSKQSRPRRRSDDAMYVKWGKSGGTVFESLSDTGSDHFDISDASDDEYAHTPQEDYMEKSRVSSPPLYSQSEWEEPDAEEAVRSRSEWEEPDAEEVVRSRSEWEEPDAEEAVRKKETTVQTASNSGNIPPRAVLAGCNTGMSADKYARAIAELKGLAQACGLDPVSIVTQNADTITHATYMGSGKVSFLKKEVEKHDADIVLFNEGLTPMQMRNLEKILDTEVLDRTGLILQIFASRARTREARLQVESAQLQYMLPRLVGMRAELSRQGGGSGRLSNKGAGEQKLELDRRRIEHRIAELRRELEVVSRERATQRSRRMQTGMTRVALVGYTNAGKSTVMNALLKLCSNKQVFEADMLFATLDTSVRRIDAPGHIPFLLSDTVGFVSDLPHSLVDAFRSTLDEVCCADLLLEVVDFSDPDYRDQIEVTAKTLAEIGAGHIPVVYLYNKTDLALQFETKSRPIPESIPYRRGDVLYLAAGKGIGIPDILQLIDDALGEERITAEFLVPYKKGSILQEIRSRGALLSEEYLPDGISVKARCRRDDAAKFSRMISAEPDSKRAAH